MAKKEETIGQLLVRQYLENRSGTERAEEILATAIDIHIANAKKDKVVVQTQSVQDEVYAALKRHQDDLEYEQELNQWPAF